MGYLFKLCRITSTSIYKNINSDGEHATIHRGKWFIDDIAIKRLEELRGFNDGAAGLPLTSSPATIDDFCFVISNLQKEVEDLKKRVEILENEKEKAEKSSWINRVFRT